MARSNSVADIPAGRVSPDTPASQRDAVLTPADFIGSPPARFDANLEAIRVLKRLEAQGRDATPQEQAVLARYSGFGDSAFNPGFEDYNRSYYRPMYNAKGEYDPEGARREVEQKKGIWQRRAEELRELTTDDEYRSIERSRINAFYTTPEVISSMWESLRKMGVGDLPRIRVLEPSAGAGRFLGLQPVDLAARSQRQAVELDTMTAKILQRGYPDTNVHATGFQEAPIPDGSIDVAISNVPFMEQANVADKEYLAPSKKFLTKALHNYFFAKALDKLRPGGILAFVTTHHTLDAPSARPVRDYLASQADLVGAVRLPKGTFKDTEVVTDIIYLRKRHPDEAPGDTSWVQTKKVELSGKPRYGATQYKKVDINQYFLDHPDMALGEHSLSGSMRSDMEYALEAPAGQDITEALAKAAAKLPAGVVTPPREEENRGGPNPTIAAADKGAFIVDGEGQLVIQTQRGVVTPKLDAAQQSRVRAMLKVRDAARQTLAAQLRDAPDAELAQPQTELNSLYNEFVSTYGPLNDKANADLMKRDPDGPFLRALEHWDDSRVPPDLKATADQELTKAVKATKQVTPELREKLKMPLFYGRVVKGLGQKRAASLSDGIAVSLNEKGRIDFAFIGSLLGLGADDVRQQMADAGLVFKNPLGDWEEKDKYLTGNVREKLREARSAALHNRAFQVNVDALAAVQPRDLLPSEISANLGAPWVPEQYVNDFVRDILQPWNRHRDYWAYNEALGTWTFKAAPEAIEFKLRSEWGTKNMSAVEIIDRLLNGKSIEVTEKVPGEDKRVRLEKETAEAQAKAQEVAEKFREWAWEDGERAKDLAGIYNDTFNNLRPREFDGSHQSFPGMDKKWAGWLHPHQKDAIWRVVTDGTALLAHEVGFGKTAAMVASGMEVRRLGLSRKNMYVVPKATHAQFVKQFKEIYPYANILSPAEDDFSPGKRPEFLSRVATGDWDAVIVSDSQFERIPLKPQTEAEFLNQEIDNYREALGKIDPKADSKSHKDVQKAIDRLYNKLRQTQLKLAERSDDTIEFEDLGVDQLFVDEADAYKNLRFATAMSRIKGLPNSDSQRAWDMYQKVRYLQKQGGGRGVVFATGTPIANTVAEAWTQMRYLQEPLLKERGLQHFDAWAKTFGDISEGIEATAQGTYRTTARFAKFKNLPELSRLWQTTADIRMVAEVPAMVKLRPRLTDDKGHNRRTVLAGEADAALREYMGELQARAEALKSGKVPPEVDNMLKISSDARKASLDMRLVDPTAPENPNGKVVAAAKNIARVFRETEAEKGTQLVFLDLGTPKAKDKEDNPDAPQTYEEELAEEQAALKDVYDSLRKKLAAAGVPANQIAFIHDAKNDKQRLDLFRRVNDGQIRVLIGSTGKMGAGVNVQKRAAALHHLDAPWRPRDIEQREGRILRQGNEVYGPQFGPEGQIVDPGKGVKIFTYVTPNSFDEFMWQAIEKKSNFIRAIMKREVTAREMEDADDLTISAAEAKAIASGNPDVMKAVNLQNQLSKLQLLRASHLDAQTRVKTQLATLPTQIRALEATIVTLKQDIGAAEKTPGFSLTVNGKTYGEKDKQAAGEALAEAIKKATPAFDPALADRVGTYRGYNIYVMHSAVVGGLAARLLLRSPVTKNDYTTTSVDVTELTPAGVLQRIQNRLDALPRDAASKEEALQAARMNQAAYETQLGKPFPQETRYIQMRQELARLNKKLQGEEVEGDSVDIPDDIDLETGEPLDAEIKAFETPAPEPVKEPEPQAAVVEGTVVRSEPAAEAAPEPVKEAEPMVMTVATREAEAVSLSTPEIKERLRLLRQEADTLAKTPNAPSNNKQVDKLVAGIVPLMDELKRRGVEDAPYEGAIQAAPEPPLTDVDIDYPAPKARAAEAAQEREAEAPAPAVVEAEAAPVAKERWEMTREEYFAHPQPPTPQVAQATPLKSVTITAMTLNGPRSYRGKEYAIPGYDGPRIGVRTFKEDGKTYYEAYLLESGTFLYNNNGVNDLEFTLGAAASRVKEAAHKVGIPLKEIGRYAMLGEAIRSGKEIPAAIMAEYPQLAEVKKNLEELQQKQAEVAARRREFEEEQAAKRAEAAPAPAKTPSLEADPGEDYVAGLVKQINDRRDQRDWASMPQSFKDTAIAALKDKLRPSLRGQGNNYIRARTKLAQATDFDELREAVQALRPRQSAAATEQVAEAKEPLLINSTPKWEADKIEDKSDEAYILDKVAGFPDKPGYYKAYLASGEQGRGYYYVPEGVQPVGAVRRFAEKEVAVAQPKETPTPADAALRVTDPTKIQVNQILQNLATGEQFRVVRAGASPQIVPMDNPMAAPQPLIIQPSSAASATWRWLSVSESIEAEKAQIRASERAKRRGRLQPAGSTSSMAGEVVVATVTDEGVKRVASAPAAEVAEKGLAAVVKEQSKREPEKSKGHVMFLGDFEFYKKADGTLYRANISNVLDVDGYRHGRFEATAEQADRVLENIVNPPKLELTPLTTSPVMAEKPETPGDKPTDKPFYYYNPAGKKFLPIPDAKPVTVTGLEQFDLAIHPDLGNSKEWAISEGRTGALLATGKTQQEAIDSIAKRGITASIVERGMATTLEKTGMSPRWKGIEQPQTAPIAPPEDTRRQIAQIVEDSPLVVGATVLPNSQFLSRDAGRKFAGREGVVEEITYTTIDGVREPRYKVRFDDGRSPKRETFAPRGLVAQPMPAEVTPKPEPAPVAAAVKEPWEMSLEEFSAAVTVTPSGKDSWVHLPNGRRWLEKGRSKTKAVANLHHNLVQHAVKTGRVVPPDALKDYPDLAPKTVAAETMPKLEPSRAVVEEAAPAAPQGVTVERDNTRVMVKFDGEPDEATKARLKDAGFVWQAKFKMWISSNNTQSRALADALEGKAAPLPEAAPAPSSGFVRKDPEPAVKAAEELKQALAAIPAPQAPAFQPLSEAERGEQAEAAKDWAQEKGRPWFMAVMSFVSGRWDDVARDVMDGRLTAEEATEIIRHLEKRRLLAPKVADDLQDKMERARPEAAPPASFRKVMDDRPILVGWHHGILEPVVNLATGERKFYRDLPEIPNAKPAVSTFTVLERGDADTKDRELNMGIIEAKVTPTRVGFTAKSFPRKKREKKAVPPPRRKATTRTVAAVKG